MNEFSISPNETKRRTREKSETKNEAREVSRERVVEKKRER